MRIKLKHQVFMAPATVLFIAVMLLGFLQYTYWDLSVKRRQASDLGKAFIALAEADLSAKRIQGLTLSMRHSIGIDTSRLEEMNMLYTHLSDALERAGKYLDIEQERLQNLESIVAKLNPEEGIDTERFLATLDILRPQLVYLIEKARSQRGKLKSLRNQSMDELVARTTMVSLVVMSAAIIIGILLSWFFSRRILRRIQVISNGANNLLRGESSQTDTPETISDELDDLTVSLNSMADKLIRVVGAEKLLQGAEDERRRIARDLHDQTLADLSNVLRSIQEIKEESACRDAFEDLERRLQAAINNLREVMDDLHPQTLDVLGLTAALEAYLESHENNSSIETNFFASAAAEDLDLPKQTQLQLYRIALEALHNVYKHADATRLELTLDCTDTELILTVEDNGKGFEARPDSTGRGLHNIQERARIIGARYKWKPSRFSSGTCFELTMPLEPTPKLTSNT
ncbi:MAG: ATP-binding protein [Desulfuromonadaceae bacterium]